MAISPERKQKNEQIQKLLQFMGQHVLGGNVSVYQVLLGSDKKDNQSKTAYADATSAIVMAKMLKQNADPLPISEARRNAAQALLDTAERTLNQLDDEQKNQYRQAEIAADKAIFMWLMGIYRLYIEQLSNDQMQVKKGEVEALQNQLNIMQELAPNAEELVVINELRGFLEDLEPIDEDALPDYLRAAPTMPPALAAAILPPPMRFFALAQSSLAPIFKDAQRENPSDDEALALMRKIYFKLFFPSQPYTAEGSYYPGNNLDINSVASDVAKLVNKYDSLLAQERDSWISFRQNSYMGLLYLLTGLAHALPDPKHVDLKENFVHQHAGMWFEERGVEQPEQYLEDVFKTMGFLEADLTKLREAEPQDKMPVAQAMVEAWNVISFIADQCVQTQANHYAHEKQLLADQLLAQHQAEINALDPKLLNDPNLDIAQAPIQTQLNLDVDDVSPPPPRPRPSLTFSDPDQGSQHNCDVLGPPGGAGIPEILQSICVLGGTAADYRLKNDGKICMQSSKGKFDQKVCTVRTPPPPTQGADKTPLAHVNFKVSRKSKDVYYHAVKPIFLAVLEKARRENKPLSNFELEIPHLKTEKHAMELFLAYYDVFIKPDAAKIDEITADANAFSGMLKLTLSEPAEKAFADFFSVAGEQRMVDALSKRRIGGISLDSDDIQKIKFARRQFRTYMDQRLSPPALKRAPP